MNRSTATTSTRSATRRRAAGRIAVAAIVAAASVPLVAAPAAAADADSTVGRIAYTSAGDIWTMAGDGSDPRRVTTDPGFDSAPTWSPDGTKIAFTSYRAGNHDVYVINADGTGEVRLTHGIVGDGNPSWSPDGFSIAFSKAANSSSSELWVMNADGTSETLLVGSAGFDDFADWSPDGSRIAFISSRDGGREVYTVRADGTDPRRVTTTLPGGKSKPTWTPDSSAIVFEGFEGGSRVLYRIAPDGTGLTTVVPPPTVGYPQNPSISPDGARLAYDLNTDPALPGIRSLIVSDADGTDPVALSTGTTSAGEPEFSPATADGSGPTVPGTGTGATSAGQTFDLAVTSPAPGASTSASTDPFPVGGTVTLSATSERPYRAAYVVDVSGSTSTVRGQDCDGSGAFDTVADNFNQDSSTGDILDCEIAAVMALNTAVGIVPSATVGVVALGHTAQLADMSPAPGDQPSIAATAHEATGSPRGNVETVLRSLRAGEVRAYTQKIVNTSTDYDAALQRVNQYFLPFPTGGSNVTYFLSDGVPNPGTFDTTTEGPLHTAAFRGTRIFTYAVGAAAGGCGAGQPLRVIAERTGGTCTAVENPSLLAAAVASPATLASVQVRLDDGTPVSATVDTSQTPASWQAVLPGGLPAGPHTLTVTATASDGSAVTATSTITGLAAPAVEAGGPYTVDEGGTVTLDGSVTDADSPEPDVEWTPADLLEGADTLTPSFAGTDDGTTTFTLTATDADSLTGSDTATVQTVNVAPVLGAAALDPAPVTGSGTTLTVPFTDPGTQDTHTATVDWGDGTTEPLTVTPSAGGGEVGGSHTYATGGEYTVTITVTDDDGGTGTTQAGPFRVNTAPEANAGGTYTVDEGTPLALAGTAADADGDVVTSTWSPADRVADPASTTSSYDTTDDADETLTLTVTDGDLTSTAQAQVTVHNVAPTLANLTAPEAVVPPGQEVVLTATYDDPGVADTHTVSVDWGDGTVEESAVSGGALEVRHTYASGGAWTVSLTLTDDDGGSDVATTSVVTNRPPVVDAGDDLVVDEGTLAQLAATATDPDGDALTLSWTPVDAVLNAAVEDAQVSAADDGTVELTLTALDPHGATASDTVTVQVRNVAPVVTELTATTQARSVGEPVRVTAAYTDAGALDTHTARVDWGDGTSSDETAEAGAVAAEHAYAAPGIYTVTVTVTDDDGSAASRTAEDVVVVDRDGGFVTGHGTFESPAGAYRADPGATGRATVNAAALYLPFGAEPHGVTQLRLHAGDLRFSSADYDWLVVSDGTATYRGTGTVIGRGTYAFLLTASDLPPSDGGDRVRIRIWQESTGAVLYDNGTVANSTGSPLEGGALVVHE